MRICIYRSDGAPDLTLLLREGSPLPPIIDVRSWTKFKTVTEGEISEDLLSQIDGPGYSLVRLEPGLQH